MARATTRFLALAMVMMMAGVIISDRHAFAQSCDNNVVQGLVSQCEQYVTRGGPKSSHRQRAATLSRRQNWSACASMSRRPWSSWLTQRRWSMLHKLVGFLSPMEQNVEWQECGLVSPMCESTTYSYMV
ncbi:hypothetical protein Acr_28g0014370 [Actinidia rufa]|uniref:Uncharacterized protein n=1 Tax=Actinidia rufa TaxID=165716 RepID=A0A7J0HCJ1_9ERIC|nr:hypothetical protein Acr_28g0014370 [Actinidia rufa]